MASAPPVVAPSIPAIDEPADPAPTGTTGVVVIQTLTGVQVTPVNAQVMPSGTQQFSASATDQLGKPIANVAFVWSASGGGTISASGAFTAAAAGGGPFTITAGASGVSGTASVTVSMASQPPSGPTSYATDFNLTETPISESGVWRNGKTNGVDWCDVAAAGGIAFGTQVGSLAHYDDSLACLSGYPADHGAAGTIVVDAAGDAGSYHEVEILLRFDISAHTARGYEFNYAYNGQYWGFVGWNGPLDDFTFFTGSAAGTNGPALASGDVLSATAIGNEMKAYLNGVLIATLTDSTWTDGNPGMGHWRRNGTGTTTRLSYTHYEAYSIP